MNSECTNSFTKNEAPITPTNLNLVTFTKYTRGLYQRATQWMLLALLFG